MRYSGFAGYFDATLYGDVHLSIYPPTHTPGMFSWFPIFFPLVQPAHCPAGAAVEARQPTCFFFPIPFCFRPPVSSSPATEGRAIQVCFFSKTFYKLCVVYQLTRLVDNVI